MISKLRENTIINKSIDLICTFAIFPFVWIIWAKLSNNNLNIFNLDDNIFQWLPVINDTFSHFFSTGSLNIWNYYLMGGINILETGIYAILNPLMLCGYAIYRLLGISNTITICIYLTVSISMCIYYWVFRKNGMNILCSFALIYCILACSSFYSFSHWYYVFNNLLIGSLIALYFTKFYNGKYKYVFLGVILGESVYLGNVQYTVMWYIAIGLILLFDILFDFKFEKIIIALSNIGIGLFLNLPQVILNYRASKNTVFEGKNEGFWNNQLRLTSIFSHGFLPDSILEKLLNEEFSEAWFTSNFYFIGIFLICFVCAIVWIIKKGIKNNSLLSAHILCAIFFLCWSIGKKGGGSVDII